MSQIVDEIVEANKKYVSTFGNKKDLALPPARIRDTHLRGCTTRSGKICRLI